MQLSGVRSEGNAIRQHSHSWHDSRHYSLHSYAGVPLNILIRASFSSLCSRRRRCLLFVGQIPQRTRGDSTTLYWNSWIIWRRPGCDEVGFQAPIFHLGDLYYLCCLGGEAGATSVRHYESLYKDRCCS